MNEPSSLKPWIMPQAENHLPFELKTTVLAIPAIAAIYGKGQRTDTGAQVDYSTAACVYAEIPRQGGRSEL